MPGLYQIEESWNICNFGTDGETIVDDFHWIGLIIFGIDQADFYWYSIWKSSINSKNFVLHLDFEDATVIAKAILK